MLVLVYMIPCNMLLLMWLRSVLVWLHPWLAVLLGAGTKGKRAALKHARIMMHQPSGAIGGQASDIEITVNEIGKLKRELYDVVNYHTGKAC